MKNPSLADHFPSHLNSQNTQTLFTLFFSPKISRPKPQSTHPVFPVTCITAAATSLSPTAALRHQKTAAGLLLQISFLRHSPSFFPFLSHRQICKSIATVTLNHLPPATAATAETAGRRLLSSPLLLFLLRSTAPTPFFIFPSQQPTIVPPNSATHHRRLFSDLLHPTSATTFFSTIADHRTLPLPPSPFEQQPAISIYSPTKPDKTTHLAPFFRRHSPNGRPPLQISTVHCHHRLFSPLLTLAGGPKPKTHLHCHSSSSPPNQTLKP